MIWRLDDLPELAHLAPEDRKRLLRNHAGRAVEINFMIQSMVRAVALTAIAFMLFAWAINLLLPTHVPLPPPNQPMPPPAAVSHPISPLLVVFLFTVFWILSSVGFYLYYMIQVRGQIRIALLEHLEQGGDLPVCLSCGYGFDHITPDTCPECGAAAR